tara:strand:- start:338 stop:574 length:237 start_codon:yes stop_codon:yes gene_type:complete
MIVNSWESSRSAANKLGLKETDLSNLRAYGLFRPGIHWRSSQSGQKKPWAPEAIYNVKNCKKVINKNYSLKMLHEFAA